MKSACSPTQNGTSNSSENPPSSSVAVARSVYFPGESESRKKVSDQSSGFQIPLTVDSMKSCVSVVVNVSGGEPLSPAQNRIRAVKPSPEAEEARLSSGLLVSSMRTMEFSNAPQKPR